MGFERNVLINQLRPDFADIRAARPRQVLWDARLFAPSSRIQHCHCAGESEMDYGNAVTLIPVHAVLTTQERRIT
jgi:hypothetical protein